MENASKALIIAGGVLLTMLILSIGVYLYGRLGVVSDSYLTQLEVTELNKYNSKFEVFIGREDITAQEIITLVSFTQQQARGTKVWLQQGGTDIEISTFDSDKKNNFLSAHILTHSKDPSTDNEVVENLYQFISIDYTTNGQVSEIKLKQKT